MQELSADSRVILDAFAAFEALHLSWTQDLLSDTGTEAVRGKYYDLEKLKGRIDRALYNWRKDKDWRQKEEWQQEDDRLRPVHFALQRLMLEAQNAYRNFLQTHQNGVCATKVVVIATS